MRKRLPAVLCFIFLVTLCLCLPVQADGGDDLRSKAQNPVSSMYSLPLKFTADFNAPNGSAFIMNVNPVVPVTVGDWNLINRALIPLVASVDGYIEGTPGIPAGSPSNDRETGIGDINYSLFVSPAKSKGLIWGLGPSIMMPTASSDSLGSGKWSIGPTGILLLQPKWGTYGGLVRQLWDFAGDSDRGGVNQTLIEPFLNYNLKDGWYLIMDPIITANWYAPSSNRWTVPLGGGAGKLFTIGKQAVNSRIEAYYNVVQPDGAPEWQTTFTFQFLFPK